MESPLRCPLHKKVLRVPGKKPCYRMRGCRLNNQNESKNYRLELERKVEELRRSQEELEASRNKFALLYDFAPVGYFTLDGDGLIKTVNLTGVQLARCRAPRRW